jgi:hypothetical protein
LAVNVGEVATPLALVAVVTAVNPPAKVAFALLPSTVNVTVVPLTRFPYVSLTVACSGAANIALGGVLCGVPPVAVMLAGVPPRLVIAKLAAVATPETVAVTV